jgi:hypothetical protein
MRPVALISLVVLLSLVFIPSVSALGSNDFYLYQDTNGDGTFDHRTHFRGDLQAELSKYENKSSIDTCWRHVEIEIYNVHCGNDPPCPYSGNCQWTGSIALVYYFSAAPCSCTATQATQEGEDHIFIGTRQNNVYSQIPISGLEFKNLLFGKFQVVEEEKNTQRCDASFSIDYNLICEPTWYCPSHTCYRNPNVYITQIITLEPICECHYYTPPGHTLSKEGVICLMVLIILTTVFVMLRKQKIKTA